MVPFCLLAVELKKKKNYYLPFELLSPFRYWSWSQDVPFHKLPSLVSSLEKLFS